MSPRRLFFDGRRRHSRRLIGELGLPAPPLTELIRAPASHCSGRARPNNKRCLFASPAERQIQIKSNPLRIRMPVLIISAAEVDIELRAPRLQFDLRRLWWRLKRSLLICSLILRATMEQSSIHQKIPGRKKSAIPRDRR